MDVQKFAEEVFRSEPKVRYVGVLDNRLHVLISRMREGVQSLTSDEDDKHWLVLVPNILIDCAEKLSPALGLVESVTIRYQNVFLVFFKLENLTVVLSFEPTVIRPFMTALSESMRKLGANYLRIGSAKVTVTRALAASWRASMAHHLARDTRSLASSSGFVIIGQ